MMSLDDMEAFLCLDCREPTDLMGEYYMVHDNVWLQVNPEKEEGMLCIGCLENRLERKLTRSDFTDCLVNTVSFASYTSDRLQERWSA